MFRSLRLFLNEQRQNIPIFLRFTLQNSEYQKNDSLNARTRQYLLPETTSKVDDYQCSTFFRRKVFIKTGETNHTHIKNHIILGLFKI